MFNINRKPHCAVQELVPERGASQESPVYKGQAAQLTWESWTLSRSECGATMLRAALSCRLCSVSPCTAASPLFVVHRLWTAPQVYIPVVSSWEAMCGGRCPRWWTSTGALWVLYPDGKQLCPQLRFKQKSIRIFSGSLSSSVLLLIKKYYWLVFHQGGFIVYS